MHTHSLAPPLPTGLLTKDYMYMWCCYSWYHNYSMDQRHRCGIQHSATVWSLKYQVLYIIYTRSPWVAPMWWKFRWIQILPRAHPLYMYCDKIFAEFIILPVAQVALQEVTGLKKSWTNFSNMYWRKFSPSIEYSQLGSYITLMQSHHGSCMR